MYTCTPRTFVAFSIDQILGASLVYIAHAYKLGVVAQYDVRFATIKSLVIIY